jgi:hypothetical protein
MNVLTTITAQSSRQATIDLTKAYAQYGATKLERTFFLNGTNDAAIIVIEDTIQTNGSLPMEWTMNTRANVSVSTDGLIATLHSGEAVIQGTLTAPVGVVFSTSQVNPAPPNDKINGVTRLMVTLSEEQSKEATIRVKFAIMK